jgi:hypothetical protein
MSIGFQQAMEDAFDEFYSQLADLAYDFEYTKADVRDAIKSWAGERCADGWTVWAEDNWGGA